VNGLSREEAVWNMTNESSDTALRRRRQGRSSDDREDAQPSEYPHGLKKPSNVTHHSWHCSELPPLRFPSRQRARRLSSKIALLFAPFPRRLSMSCPHAATIVFGPLLRADVVRRIAAICEGLAALD